MSALVKGKLKAARDAIGKKDWAAAQIAAEAALDFEPDNYNAYACIFLFLKSRGELKMYLATFFVVSRCSNWASTTKASK